MNQRLVNVPPPDYLDLDALRRMRDSAIWKLLWSRVQAMLDEQVKACTTAEGTALYRAQGQVAAIQRVMQLPAIVEAEIRAKKER